MNFPHRTPARIFRTITVVCTALAVVVFVLMGCTPCDSAFVIGCADFAATRQ